MCKSHARAASLRHKKNQKALVCSSDPKITAPFLNGLVSLRLKNLPKVTHAWWMPCAQWATRRRKWKNAADLVSRISLLRLSLLKVVGDKWRQKGTWVGGSTPLWSTCISCEIGLQFKCVWVFTFHSENMTSTSNCQKAAIVPVS